MAQICSAWRDKIMKLIFPSYSAKNLYVGQFEVHCYSIYLNPMRIRSALQWTRKNRFTSLCFYCCCYFYCFGFSRHFSYCFLYTEYKLARYYFHSIPSYKLFLLWYLFIFQSSAILWQTDSFCRFFDSDSSNTFVCRYCELRYSELGSYLTMAIGGGKVDIFFSEYDGQCWCFCRAFVYI